MGYLRPKVQLGVNLGMEGLILYFNRGTECRNKPKGVHDGWKANSIKYSRKISWDEPRWWGRTDHSGFLKRY